MTAYLAHIGLPWSAHTQSAGAALARRRMIAAGLTLAVLLLTGACAPAPRSAPALSSSPLRTPTQTPTPILNPLARIHHAGPDNIPLFVSVTFTSSTSYEQAVAILEAEPYAKEPYPWTCDEPRSSTPPALGARRAAFTVSHALLLSYATWEQLTRIAASPQVVSVDGTYVYPCP